jgi:hypothetical protein
MKLYSICFGLLIVFLCPDRGKQTVIDTSCEQREVKLPQRWRDECLDDMGILRKNLDGQTRQACVNISGNNRNLKRKGCVKKLEAKP